MAFQDVDETDVVEVPRAPTAFERGARKIFLEDWSLKLLALTITLILWFAVTGQNQPLTIRTGVQLNLIKPSNLDISNDPPKTVEVVLRGSRPNLQSLSPLDLVATVDVSDHLAGERVIRLSLDRVTMQLPDGVKIESFQPSTIPVRLEPRMERQVPVEVKTEGKPADGYEVYGISPAQTTVRVRGPESRIAALQKAPTETISLSGRSESFTVSRVAIDISDQKIEVLDPLVDLAVEVGEKRTEKSFSGVAARSISGVEVRPATAEVTLAGPASVLSELRPEDVKVVVAISTTGGSVAGLELPPAVKDRVKLLSVKPSQFSLVR
ncbi:MAG: YbbR-like domain-containing protein [Pyrinomonadaceae bacterium]|nr:YbbR-like domain-containing protein [Pyrinomonadaceae bacterium]